MPTISFSGIASGIDSDALIKATSDASRKQRVTPSQTKIKDLDDTNTKFDELKTKLTAIQTIAKDFTTLSGGALVKQAQSSNETITTAAASNAATNGTYTVTTSQLAKNATLSFNDRFSSSTSVINSGINNGASSTDRTITVTVGTGSNLETVNVVLSSTSTISDYVTSFNNASSLAEASIVNVGTASSPSYAIVINSSFEGTEKGTLAVSRGLEITSSGTLSAQTTSQAEDAEFTLSGINGTITRSSNSIADVITGVTLNLKETGAATITVTDDAEATSSNVQEFITAFNDLVSFIKENNLITRQEDANSVSNIFAPLSTTRVDDSALSALRSALSSSSYSSGSAIKIFPDLGITSERDGSLKFDTTVFEAAIAKEPTSAKSIITTFADTIALTGGTIDQYTRFNGLIDTTVTGNKTQINLLNEKITQAEQQISKTEESMRRRFASLEALMGKLQSQQQNLSSALAGLG